MGILETTHEIYGAFGRGDVASMLSKFSADIVIEPWATDAVKNADVPYYKTRRGLDGAKEFYKSMEAVELKKFRTTDFLQGANRVCVVVDIEFVVKATGAQVRDQEIHLWKFDDNDKVVELQHFGDTAKHIDANARSVSGGAPSEQP